MKTYTLNVDPRIVFGSKTKTLRKKGIVPATVYGKNVKSVSVQADYDVFMNIYENAGETGVVELILSGQKRPVLIHSVQTHPVTGMVLHVEFHQVDLKEKVKASIPIISVGIPLAVSQKTGLLIQTLNDLEVEALPTDLPDKIEVDVANLAEIDDQILVSDLKKSPQVEILSASDQSVFRIVPLAKQEEAPPPPPESVAGEVTGVAEEGAEQQPGDDTASEAVEDQAKNKTDSSKKTV